MVRHARRGFTLVELLVVIAIISLLIAMLLPAIQAARESGRRAACSSNLKQFATAVHIFHERHNSMPTYWGFFPDGATYGKGVYGSWYVHLMPVMEQVSSYQTIWDDQAAAGERWGRKEVATIPPADPNAVCKKKVTENQCSSGTYGCKSTGGTNTTNHNGHSWDNPESKCGCWDDSGYVGDHSVVDLGDAVVPCGTPVLRSFGLSGDPVKMAPGVLFCGSDPGQPVNSIAWEYSQTYALTNYQANFNVFARGKKYSSNKPQSFGAITDGQSQTVLFAEGHRICDRDGSRGIRVAVEAAYWRQNFGIDWHQQSNTLMFQDRPTAAKCDNWRVQANHGGALLVALGDASVRGISSKISRREVTDPDNPAPGVNPDPGLSNPLGNWDRLLLPDDGGGANFE